jgi:NAD(P)-binding Rossmann-like domain
VLGALAATAGLPRLASALPSRRKVGIVGGGMAGVSLAWLLDGPCDVVLLEARDSIGGNVQSLEVEVDGQAYVVDIGAQFFHPGPYPTYTQLLSVLGLYPPGPPGATESHSFPASITLATASRPLPRFVSPVLPDRVWPLFARWNRPGLEAFAVGFAAAKAREEAGASWALTLEAGSRPWACRGPSGKAGCSRGRPRSAPGTSSSAGPSPPGPP